MFPPPARHTAPPAGPKARRSRRSARNSPENRRPPRPPAEIRARSSPRRRAAIPLAALRSGSRELLRVLLLSAFRGHVVRAVAQSYSFVCPKGARYTGEGNSAVSTSLTGPVRFRVKMGGRCFLTHLVVRSACRAWHAGPQFFHALSCRRSGRCRPSLCRVSLLFEGNADHG